MFIYEHFTGGSLTDKPSLPSVFSEAYAMLSALLKDFSYNAGCEPTVMFDKKLASLIEPLAAKNIMKVSSVGEHERVFMSALSQADAALLVAPETEGILPKMTQLAEDEGNATLLGSSSGAVKFASDKEKAIELARSSGVAVPRSITTSADENEATVNSLARDIGYPVVIKPNDGAGCEGVLAAKDRQDIERALKIAGRGRSKRRLLVQEYVRGTDASVSMLSSMAGNALPLSLNRQTVELRTPEGEDSTYSGGYTPFEHPMKSETFDCARKIIEAIKGSKGYTGIDFVLTDEKPVFMEVNARITTSYAGLYRVMVADGREGIAPAIIDAAADNSLPSQIAFRGIACYSKFKFKADLKVDRDMVDVLSNLEYVESPPFPNMEGGNEGFLVNVGKSLDEALTLRSRNEKKFEQIALKLQRR